MSERKPYKFVTPRLVLIFPKLTKPDTKFKAEGEYRAKGRCRPEDFPEKDLTALQTMLDEFVEEKKAELTKKKEIAKVKNLTVIDILKVEKDKETDEETGFVTVSAKMQASGVSKKDGKPWKRAPKLFDAKQQKLPANAQIWGGSEAKLAVEAVPYYMPKDNEAGIAFYLNAVQVLKLVKGGGDNAADHGFGDEDGYDGSGEADSESPFGEESENPAPAGEGETGPKAGDDF
jgi:hypothetical protein